MYIVSNTRPQENMYEIKWLLAINLFNENRNRYKLFNSSESVLHKTFFFISFNINHNNLICPIRFLIKKKNSLMF